MTLKKAFLLHVIPLAMAAACIFFLKGRVDRFFEKQQPFGFNAHQNPHHSNQFYTHDITPQAYFSLSLKQGIPVLMGSSELTSKHLKGIAHRYFAERRGSRVISIGHGGFQSLAMLAVLAANRTLLRDARLTIILSPGWFEKQYASGTSLQSFFEFCPPNTLYQVAQDTGLDAATKDYITAYIRRQYDKISSPDAVTRYLADQPQNPLHKALYSPFACLDRWMMKARAGADLFMSTEAVMIRALNESHAGNYPFHCARENWDSLYSDAKTGFGKLCTSNSMGVEDSYYRDWMRDHRKKHIEAVPLEANTEYRDFVALVGFLRASHCRPLFVMMPLNTKAHDHAEALMPVISEVTKVLAQNNMTCLDMFTPNLAHYENGVLEDIMHPHEYGWYQIDKFMSDHYCR